MGFWRHLFKPLDRPAFARAVVEALTAQGRGDGLRVDDEDFCVRYGDDRTFFLGNLYGEYLGAGALSRSRVFDFVVSQALTSAPEVPTAFVAARKSLMPAVRDPLTFDLQRLLLPPTPPTDAGPRYDPAWAPLADDYSVSVVFDGPTTMSYLNRDQFRAWDVPFERALEYALDNLAGRPFRVVPLQPGLFCFDTSDSYDAARLLLRDRIRALQVKGRPVAALPNRECLLVTGEDDEEGLAAFAREVEARYSHPRAIGTSPLLLDGDAWRSFRPEGTSPLAVRLRNLGTNNRGTRYADQKKVLEKLHAREGKDLFVASFSGFSPKDSDEVRSYAVWSEGVSTLLPQAEFVAFVKDGQEEPVLVPWDAVVAEAGSLMQPQGLVPERWAVTSFPGPELLARLAERAFKP